MYLYTVKGLRFVCEGIVILTVQRVEPLGRARAPSLLGDGAGVGALKQDCEFNSFYKAKKSGALDRNAFSTIF